MKIAPLAAAASLVVAGCAQTPRATISYPLARTDAAISVVRTIKCDKDDVPHVVDLPTVAVTFSADPNATGTLNTSKLDGVFADTSLDIGFTADQRLKTVNTESIGQGEAILKSAISLASSVFFPKAGSERAPDPTGMPTAADIKSQCADLNRTFGTEAMTITYAGSLDLPETSGKTAAAIAANRSMDFRLQPVPQDLDRSRRFAALLGSVCARFHALDAPKAPVSELVAPGGYATLTARQPRAAVLRIAVSPSTDVCPVDGRPGFIWAGRLAVGQLGTLYQIPIPRAAVFGKQTFELELDESGGLTKIKYGKSTGAGAAIATGQAGVDAVKPPTAADQAAAIEAEIALRKAQDHRAKCLADPTAC
ncbi:hypothetical protein U1839_11635 [Sphingomonas sp. RT2P30]|uniref:hypothetical protein n=1 Tax=Parasphingomonas halimpatiens TaxID=3096162 RepID=UPI002FC889E2